MTTTRACSGLIVVTPRESVPTSAVPVGDLFARGDGFDAYASPALLQHYVIDGSPPRFHATSNALLNPMPTAGSVTSDGQYVFACTESSPERLRVWDGSNRALADVVVADQHAANGCGALPYQGLALVRHSNYGTDDRLYMFDATGTLGWSQTGGLAMSTIGTYGCGYAFLDQAQITMMPLDGRARSATPVSGVPSTFAGVSTLSPWPGDPHAVAQVSFLPPEYVDPDGGGPPAMCTTDLVLAFDDGRAPIARTYVEDCSTMMDDLEASVLSTSFGPVLHMGNGRFALLDANADVVGAPVRVTTAGDESHLAIASGGDTIAVISTEQIWLQSSSSIAYFETVLGCSL